jgi:predicted metal-binding protein
MDISKLVTIQHKRIDAASIKWISEELRDKWCQKPYHQHPKGCPNFGKRETCPPHVTSAKTLIQNYPFHHIVWGVFEIKTFADIRREEHPEWSERQLRNPRHWQNQLKAMLRNYIMEFSEFAELYHGVFRESAYILGAGSGFWNYPSMEAACINAFATLRAVGIKYQVKPKDFIVMAAILLTHHPLRQQKKENENQRRLDAWLQ